MWKCWNHATIVSNGPLWPQCHFAPHKKRHAPDAGSRRFCGVEQQWDKCPSTTRFRCRKSFDANVLRWVKHPIRGDSCPTPLWDKSLLEARQAVPPFKSRPSPSGWTRGSDTVLRSGAGVGRRNRYRLRNCRRGRPIALSPFYGRRVPINFRISRGGEGPQWLHPKDTSAPIRDIRGNLLCPA